MKARPSNKPATRFDELQTLVKRVDTGNPSDEDLKVLREFMEANPDAWAGALGMAARTERRLLIIASQGKPAIQAQYGGELDAMRRELGADAFADPIERLLIERVVLTWFRLQWVEEHVTYTMMKDATADVAEHWDKRLTQAQSRFLKSVQALARVRKLLQRSGPMSTAAMTALLRESITAGLRSGQRDQAEPDPVYDFAGKAMAKAKKRG